jgi:GntR family transcriptional regulator
MNTGMNPGMSSGLNTEPILNVVRPQMSLPERAANDIRRAIERSAYPEGRLPAEGELAKQLGVSKATVRHAVSILEQEGLLTRRQGSGTYVSGRALGLRNNLTVNFGVTDMITASGFRPGSTDESVEITPAGDEIREVLNLGAGAEVIVLSRTRTADDRVIARTADYIPLQLFIERGLSADRAVALVRDSQSLYETLLAIGVSVRDGIAEVGPATADAALSRQLEVRRGSLLLRLDQTDYDAAEAAVLHSIEFFVADVFKFQVFRKGRDGAPRSRSAPVAGDGQNGPR